MGERMNSTRVNSSRVVRHSFYTMASAAHMVTGLGRAYLKKTSVPVFFQGQASLVRLTPPSQPPGPPRTTEHAQHGSLHIIKLCLAQLTTA